jgi:hypothetical protein
MKDIIYTKRPNFDVKSIKKIVSLLNGIIPY